MPRRLGGCKIGSIVRILGDIARILEVATQEGKEGRTVETAHNRFWYAVDCPCTSTTIKEKIHFFFERRRARRPSKPLTPKQSAKIERARRRVFEELDRMFPKK